MFIEILLVLPLYVIIFAIIYKFLHIINMMTDANDMFSDLISETPEVDIACGSAMSKREFLMEKVKNGEQISNSKTLWTKERLQKASDKVIDKLYDKYQNPEPMKVNKQEALKLGKCVCPVVIELYVEGLKNILDKIPYISGKYTINVEKLKFNISNNELFCDNLAIKIGSKMIEQMGSNSQMGVSLASMTWDAVEPVVGDSSKNKSDE